MAIFVITDERGRETQVIKPTEKAARKAFEKTCKETERLWPSLVAPKIVSVKKIGW